ncbi:RNA recognition motif domain-containing protein [Virgisporangium aurantiacum]|uniref:RRM domain-containing protein n=1 Tax=Virgisporangium aurantiacum TaxID=175570 RepID=A0A8J3ZBZ6_9ACTN|nr:RNA-binding protein [Virgisporangium aurantiacum]GIJ58920.1 hypothetical protein Vau01_064360 [Virgisporangium aurantiacum]
MNPTSSPCLDRVAGTKSKIIVFDKAFNRFAEAERWIRWDASTSNGLTHLGTLRVVNSGSAPPTAGTPTGMGADSFGPGKELFVGALSYSSTNEILANHFAKFGEVVSAAVIVDRDTMRSKGFAFVEMRTREDAERAVDGLNDQELDGRRVSVNFARPMPPRSPRSNRF